MTVYFRRHTIGKKLTCTACARGMRVSPGVSACLSYTMASIQAIDHENAHLLLLFQDEVREATSSGGVLRLGNTTVSVHAYIPKRGCVHVSPEVLARWAPR